MRAVFAALAALLFAFPALAQGAETVATTSAGPVEIFTPDDGPQRLAIGGQPVALPGRPYRAYLDRQQGDDLLFMLGDPEEGWCRMLYAWVRAEAGAVAVSPLFGTCAEAEEVGPAPAGGWRVLMAGGAPGEGYFAFDWNGGEIARTELGLRPSGQGPDEGAEFWLGRYPYDLTVAADYQDRLIALLGAPLLGVLQVNTSLSSPFEAEAGWVVGAGCEKYACPDEAAMIALAPSDGQMLVALRRAGVAVLYGGAPGAALPGAMAAFLRGE